MFSKKVEVDGVFYDVTKGSVRSLVRDVEYQRERADGAEAWRDEQQRRAEAIKDRLDAANRQLKLLGYTGEF